MDNVLCAPTAAECAYAAAFIDADGCLTVYRSEQSKGGCRWQVKVCQSGKNGKEPLTMIQSRWGGSLYMTNSKTNLGQCDMWGLSISGIDAAILLMDIEPYMTVKRQKAQSALKHYWSNPKFYRVLARIYGEKPHA